MTPLISTLLTAATLIIGVAGILYAMRFFPVVKPNGDQFEFDLPTPKDYAPRLRSMAHDIDRATDMIREETARIRSKPRVKR